MTFSRHLFYRIVSRDYFSSVKVFFLGRSQTVSLNQKTIFMNVAMRFYSAAKQRREIRLKIKRNVNYTKSGNTDGM